MGFTTKTQRHKTQIGGWRNVLLRLGLRGGLALFGNFCFGGGLEALELAEGAVEGALGAGFVAAQGGERVGAADVVQVEIGEAVARAQVGVLPFDILLLVEAAELEEATFDEADAAETPGGHDDLLDRRVCRGPGLKSSSKDWRVASNSS